MKKRFFFIVDNGRDLWKIYSNFTFVSHVRRSLVLYFHCHCDKWYFYCLFMHSLRSFNKMKFDKINYGDFQTFFLKEIKFYSSKLRDEKNVERITSYKIDWKFLFTFFLLNFWNRYVIETYFFLFKSYSFFTPHFILLLLFLHH